MIKYTEEQIEELKKRGDIMRNEFIKYMIQELEYDEDSAEFEGTLQAFDTGYENEDCAAFWEREGVDNV